jgi:hypothetical protein
VPAGTIRIQRQWSVNRLAGGRTPPDVVPPPNDQICDATEISALLYADQVDTRGANAYGYESG